MVHISIYFFIFYLLVPYNVQTLGLLLGMERKHDSKLIYY